MTSGEFRSVIDYLGLGQLDAAALLGVSERTIRHWNSGRHPVPDGVREAIERGEAWTAQAVDELVDALKDARGPAVLVYRSDEAMWAARPELRPWPARWWRHVVMRARAKVPGVAITFDGGLDAAQLGQVELGVGVHGLEWHNCDSSRSVARAQPLVVSDLRVPPAEFGVFAA